MINNTAPKETVVQPNLNLADMNNAVKNATTPSISVWDQIGDSIKGSASLGPTSWIGPALTGYDYASNGLTNSLTRDLSDWKNGARTGSSIGGVAGPWGTLAGAAQGAIAGAVGSAVGIGKTQDLGYTPGTGVYNQGGQLSDLGTGAAGAQRYKSYNDAMNYLNGANQNWNSDWSKIGDSEQGYRDLSTRIANKKGFEIGSMIDPVNGGWMGSLTGNKHKHNYVDAYKGNLNTGYNVMDDFTNGTNYGGDVSNLDTGWTPYMQQQDKIYQDRYNLLADQDRRNYENSIAQSASNLAREVDQDQYNKSKNLLDQQLARGYMNQKQYREALSQLDNNRAANLQSLLGIGNDQLDQWRTDVNQAYTNKLKSDLTDEWIKNYNAWKANDMSGLFDDANAAAQGYLDTAVSDDYLRSLMGQTDTYTPYQYMATGIAGDTDNGLLNWAGGRAKRRANLVYEGE